MLSNTSKKTRVTNPWEALISRLIAKSQRLTLRNCYLKSLKTNFHPVSNPQNIQVGVIFIKQRQCRIIQGVSKKIGISALSSSNPCIFAPTDTISEIFFA